MEQQNGEPEINGVANNHVENGQEEAPSTKVPEMNGVANGHVENGQEEAPPTIELPTEEKSREGSVGSQEGIQLSAIKIITKHHQSEDEEEESGDDEPEEEVKPKKMTKKKKKKKAVAVAQPAEVLTSTLAKAIRLINEKKDKEKHKIKQAEIRKMALDQKKRQEIAGPGRVLIHT